MSKVSQTNSTSQHFIRRVLAIYGLGQEHLAFRNAGTAAHIFSGRRLSGVGFTTLFIDHVSWLGDKLR